MQENNQEAKPKSKGGFPAGRTKGRKLKRYGFTVKSYNREPLKKVPQNTPVRDSVKKARWEHMDRFHIHMWKEVLKGKVVAIAKHCLYIVRIKSANGRYRYELFQQEGRELNYSKIQSEKTLPFPINVPLRFMPKIRETEANGHEFLDYTGYTPRPKVKYNKGQKQDE